MKKYMGKDLTAEKERFQRVVEEAEGYAKSSYMSFVECGVTRRSKEELKNVSLKKLK